MRRRLEMKKIVWLFCIYLVAFSFSTSWVGANEKRGDIDPVAKLFKGKKFPVTEKIVRLYQTKKMKEVFEVGKRMLKRNPEDILGLVIQFEEAGAKYDPDAMSRAATMLDRRLRRIKRESFQEKYRGCKVEVLDKLIDEARKMTPEEREKARKSEEDITLEDARFEMPVLTPLLMIIEEEGFLADVKWKKTKRKEVIK